MHADDPLTKATILIIDDQEPNVLLLRKVLERAGYTSLVSTTDPRQVVPLYHEHQPDLLVLDLLMPHMDGYQVMQELTKRVAEETYLPILVLTADSTPEARRRALSMGARDFLTKPFDQDEALLRIHNLLETRSLHLRLIGQNEALEKRVRERTKELRQSLELLEKTSENRRALLGRMVQVQRLAAAGVDAGLYPESVGQSTLGTSVLQQAVTMEDGEPA